MQKGGQTKGVTVLVSLSQIAFRIFSPSTLEARGALVSGAGDVLTKQQKQQCVQGHHLRACLLSYLAAIFDSVCASILCQKSWSEMLGPPIFISIHLFPWNHMARLQPWRQTAHSDLDP